MHKKLTLTLLLTCVVLQAPQLAAAQGGRAVRAQQNEAAVVPQVKKPVAKKPTLQQNPASDQVRQQLLLGGEGGVSLDSIKTTMSNLSIDPVQLAIGAALALFIRSVLVRMWHLFLAFLRLLFARRRRAVLVAAPTPQIQYVPASPQPPVVAQPPQQQPAAPPGAAPPMLTVAAA